MPFFFRNLMESAIIFRFSASDVSNTWVTCKSEVLPTRHAYLNPVSSMMSRLASSSARILARRVLPKTTISAFFSFSALAFWKNSASRGLEPGQPPSMKLTPISSRREAISSLSTTEKETPSFCAPSLNVVS